MNRYVPVAWRPLDLAVALPDGGIEVRSIPYRLNGLFPWRYADPRPIVVWVGSWQEEATVRRIETTTFRMRGITLALQRFRCLRVRVEEMPAPVRKRYRRETGFRFFDPRGRAVGPALVGKAALSASRFAALQDRTWRTTYTMPIQAWLRRRETLQDRFDELAVKREAVRRRLAMLERYPNPAQRAKYEKYRAEIADGTKKLAADLGALNADCALRAEYRFEPPKPRKTPKLR